MQALTTVCALHIGTTAFRGVMREYPGVALRVVDHVSAQLSDARSTVTEHSAGTVAQRVVGVLLRLAEKFGERTPRGVLIQMPLTRADLASMAGSTPESVSRVMSRFRAAGAIESGRRWTIITNRDTLTELGR